MVLGLGVLGFKDFGDTDNGDGFYFMDPPNLQPSPPQKKMKPKLLERPSNNPKIQPCHPWSLFQCC